MYSPTLDVHRTHVYQVLTRLRDHSLYAKLEKSIFEVPVIEFLGFTISPACVKMDQQKLSAVLNWPTPTNVKEVQQIVGFTNLYRRFIQDFSKVVAPITVLTSVMQKFKWFTEAQGTFERLKQLFTQDPILAQPDSS
ncbi:uncharacterized protein WCC33_009009 [Rhinophrynus dorsalis]